MSELLFNPLQIECTLFFQENPYTYENIDGLMLRLGREKADLEPVLNNLVKAKILNVIGEGNGAIYCYNHPDQLQVREMIWEQI